MIFGPFSEDTEYFGRPEQQWMVNFRVEDLDVIIADLKNRRDRCRDTVRMDSEAGRFARIHDPEGNPIELWQPAKIV